MLREHAEAFTWSRLPDGVGAFVAGEETLGAVNQVPAVLGAGVFEPARAVPITVVIDPAGEASLAGDPLLPVPCTVAFDDDAAVAAAVTFPTNDLVALRFADTARLRGLEHLVLDLRDTDDSWSTDVVGAALFRARGILAPRVGLATATISGRAVALARTVEVIDGRLLRRTFPGTAHLYGSGDGPTDLVTADVASWDVIVGDSADVTDLDAVVAGLAPFITAPGLLAGAGADFKLSSTIRFLAIDAWLGHTDGYCAARGDTLVHIDDGGEARLLPHDLDNITLRGPVLTSGAAVMDACRADPPCDALLREELTLTGAAVVDADVARLIADVSAAVAAAAIPGLDVDVQQAAANAVAGQLAARAGEVDAELGAR